MGNRGRRKINVSFKDKSSKYKVYYGYYYPTSYIAKDPDR
jgi:hypothetical protein